jgi:hypothetical protein
MTRDADRHSPLDDVIDEAARAMTARVVPDLRARVAARIDRPVSPSRWWQPALAAVALFVALVAWWNSAPRDEMATRGVAVQSLPSPRSAAGETPAAGAAVDSGVRRHEPAAVSRGLSPGGLLAEAVAAGVPAEALAEAGERAAEYTLPPLVVEPVRVAPLDTIDAGPTPIANIAAVVVEELHVEPLPRSHE